jgi:hypothetical protein
MEQLGSASIMPNRYNVNYNNWSMYTGRKSDIINNALKYHNGVFTSNINTDLGNHHKDKVVAIVDLAVEFNDKPELFAKLEKILEYKA